MAHPGVCVPCIKSFLVPVGNADVHSFAFARRLQGFQGALRVPLAHPLDEQRVHHFSKESPSDRVVHFPDDPGCAVTGFKKEAIFPPIPPRAWNVSFVGFSCSVIVHLMGKRMPITE